MFTYSKKHTERNDPIVEMTEQARKERNAYQREWYKNNKDKHAEYMVNYWKKKAKETEKENDK